MQDSHYKILAASAPFVTPSTYIPLSSMHIAHTAGQCARSHFSGLQAETTCILHVMLFCTMSALKPKVHMGAPNTCWLVEALRCRHACLAEAHHDSKSLAEQQMLDSVCMTCSGGRS